MVHKVRKFSQSLLNKNIWSIAFQGGKILMLVNCFIVYKRITSVILLSREQVVIYLKTLGL